MEGFNCTQGISLELAIVMQKVRELLNLPFYEIEGNASKMWMCKGSLTLHTEAYVTQLHLSPPKGMIFITGE